MDKLDKRMFGQLCQFKNIDVWLLFLEALLKSIQARQGRFHYFFGGGKNIVHNAMIAAGSASRTLAEIWCSHVFTI